MKCMPLQWRRDCVSISLDVRDARHNPQRTLLIVYQETQDESRSDFIILERGSERGRFTAWRAADLTFHNVSRENRRLSRSRNGIR